MKGNENMKVGDVVKLVKQSSTRKGKKTETGVITEINAGEGDIIDRMFPYRVDFSAGHVDWFGADVLELVSEDR